MQQFNDFRPRYYLNEYYSQVGPENASLLDFFARAYKGYAENSQEILELGGGPTLYQLISAAVPAKQIYFTDYVQANLDEIDLWIKNNQDSFDWDKFVKETLVREGRPAEDPHVEERANLLRSKITGLGLCDVFKDAPIGTPTMYDIVSTSFVAESVSSDKTEWQQTMRNIASLVKPAGTLIMCGLTGSEYWVSGEQKYKAANVTESDVRELVTTLGFDIQMLETIDAEHDESDGYQGYDGMFFLKAVKRS